MTDGTALPRTASAPGGDAPDGERELAARVIDTLLRENYGGLARRVRRDGHDALLDLPSGHGDRVLVLERDGFLADFRMARAASGRPVAALSLDDVDAAVAAVSDPLDRGGAAAFAAECRQALAARLLIERCRPAGRDGDGGPPGADGDPWSGPRGLLRYEALAAARPHPAYPTSQARAGFSDEDALRYAPEFSPRFALHWVAVPRSRLTVAGRLAPRPPGWPAPGDAGLPPGLGDSHALLPVHPLTARGALSRALAEANLTGGRTNAGPAPQRPPGHPGGAGAPGAAVVAPGTGLVVIPTLSTRTVAVAAEPGTHLKLPLPTSTLGLLNRRSIKPGTLADGALVRELLATARRADPQLDGLLLADESSYAHAGHPFLGYLLRRLPPGLGRHRIVPVAALLAPLPGPAASSGSGPVAGPAAESLVIGELARWAGHGDLFALLTAYLRALFGLQVRLFARYGIALESHQQNAALVLAPPASAGPPAPPRLLVKDLDGALIHLPRLTAELGRGAPAATDFDDPRLLTTSDDALADVFITITVHLCAGALAFGLARQGAAPLADLLALISRELTGALDRHTGWPATALLRARLLDADRLPGKSMLTAGTLVAKSRTGAGDINKFYGTDGPNYLKDTAMRNRR